MARSEPETSNFIGGTAYLMKHLAQVVGIFFLKGLAGYKIYRSYYLERSRFVASDQLHVGPLFQKCAWYSSSSVFIYELMQFTWRTYS